MVFVDLILLHILSYRSVLSAENGTKDFVLSRINNILLCIYDRLSSFVHSLVGIKDDSTSYLWKIVE